MRSPKRISATGLAALALAAAAIGLAANPARPAPETAAAGRGADLQAALERARDQLGVPGVSAAVVMGDRLRWAGVAGVARLGGAEVRAETPFITASAGKSVTAAMVLGLIDEGRVSLRDRVSDYVRGLRGARRVRIRHLLGHSSGLPDYLSSGRILAKLDGEPRHEWTRAEVLDAVGGLRFRPGSRHRYSNTNYVALGGVIEGATGSTVEAEYRRLVAGPLGLTASSWRYDATLFDRGAHPYLERRTAMPRDAWSAGFVPTDFVGEVWTDGGFATTGSELARISNSLVAGSLLEPPTRRKMLRLRGRGYGLGVFADRFRGRRIIGHDGLYEGFSAQHWTLPDGTTIAVLANLETRRGPDASWAIWKRLARVLSRTRATAAG